jgi:glutathione S-transferase
MNLLLYYAPVSCATVAFVTLAEAGAQFEIKRVDLARSEHFTPEYLRLNPKHKVPLLVVDGTPITENVAIQVWVARTFPGARLLPPDLDGEIKALSLMAWFASGIHPALTPIARPSRFCDLPGSEQNVRQCAQKLLMEHYQLADALLAGREWFLDQLTAPDIYFFWCFQRGLQFGLDLSKFTHCIAHFERMKGRASVRRLLQYDASAAPG